MASINLKARANQSEAEFWTSSEFAKVINVSPTTLKNLLKQNEIHGACQFGKQWRIHKETFYSHINKEEFNNGK